MHENPRPVPNFENSDLASFLLFSPEEKIVFLKEKYGRPDQKSYIEAVCFFLPTTTVVKLAPTHLKFGDKKVDDFFPPDLNPELAKPLEFPPSLGSNDFSIEAMRQAFSDIVESQLADSDQKTLVPSSEFIAQIISHSNILVTVIQKQMPARSIVAIWKEFVIQESSDRSQGNERIENKKRRQKSLEDESKKYFEDAVLNLTRKGNRPVSKAKAVVDYLTEQFTKKEQEKITIIPKEWLDFCFNLLDVGILLDIEKSDLELLLNLTTHEPQDN